MRRQNSIIDKDVSEFVSSNKVPIIDSHQKTIQAEAKEPLIRAEPVVLISCSKLKRTYPCEAELLYDVSSLFKKSLAYAKTISNEIFVISAKYGLLPLNEVVEPYEETLNDKTNAELAVWGKRVAGQLAQRFSIEKTEFVILAGKNYYGPLRNRLPHIRLPLLGLPIGERLAKLDELIQDGISCEDSMCLRLHKLFNDMPRFKWDTIDRVGFDNGIYIVFEDGETYHGLDRIVRVGTHRSYGRLRGRLKDHFIYESKDDSIFRKNIGRAILNKNRSTYLDVWNIDSRDTHALISIGDRYDYIFQREMENSVSEYMRSRFTFTCFPVAEMPERLRLEEGIIATLHMTADFAAGPNWYGKYSPEHEIVECGMWLKQGLDGALLSESEYAAIEKYSRSVLSTDMSQIMSRT